MEGPTDSILSIQSQVAYGHVGNSAAVLPLQRLGYEVWPVNTVQLAHHPGNGVWCGYRIEPARLATIVEGIAACGVLGQCRALLTGYLSTPEIADLALRAWQTIRAARSDAVFLCDPVIGDDCPGVYVRAGVTEAIRAQLLPAATIVTPNRFELAYLAGHPVANIDHALAAAALLRAHGPELVVVTGLTAKEAADRLGVLAATDDAAWLVTTPRLPLPVSGTGDVFSALMLGHYLRTADPAAALERAVSAVFALVETTYYLGWPELALVAAQDAFAATEIRFRAERLR